MLKRLLIAVPIAALIAAALFWAMREFVPVGRAQADYTVTILIRPKSEACRFCDPPRSDPFNRGPERPDESSSGTAPLPPPPRPRPEMEGPQSMTREPFPPPRRTKPSSSAISGQAVHDHCDRFLHRPVEFVDGARDGDHVTVDYTIMPDGSVSDVKILHSTNPSINDEVLRMVRGWRYKRAAFCERQIFAKEGPKTVRTTIEFARGDKDEQESRQ